MLAKIVISSIRLYSQSRDGGNFHTWSNGYVPPVRMGLRTSKILKFESPNLNFPLEMGSFLTRNKEGCRV